MYLWSGVMWCVSQRHLVGLILCLAVTLTACELPGTDTSVHDHISQRCTPLNWPVTLELPGETTDIHVQLQEGSSVEIVVVQANGIYGLAEAQPHMNPIVELSSREVVYESIGRNDEVGRTRFFAERLTAADVSADGRHVAYSVCYSPRGSADAPAATLGVPDSPASKISVSRSDDLHEISVLDRVTNTTERVALGRLPVLSPDGRQLAFLSEYDYATGSVEWVHPRLRLYVMDLDDGQVRELARSVISRARWSPDGEKLAYLSQHDSSRLRWWGGATLHTVRVDSTVQRQLATDAVSAAVWSPDGRRVAFARSEKGHVTLYTVAATGVDLTRVKTLAVEDWWSGDRPAPLEQAWISTVAWSPDGAELLHSCDLRICVVTVDGVRVGRSHASYGFDGEAAAWLPDGERIAIVQSRQWPDPLAFAVYTMAPSGDDVRTLGQSRSEPHTAHASRLDNSIANDCRAGIAVPDPTANSELVKDCGTLLRIRSILAGTGSLNWSADRPVSEWDAVTLGGSPLLVQGLGWFSDLTGTISPEVGDLQGLRALRLGGSRLGGTIPRELGQLANLEALYLDATNLSGPIPPELGQLGRLRVLDLSSTNLRGGIPPELGRLRSLEHLDLSFSGLSGTIPPELSQLANLKVLNLEGNRLSGSIPPELGQLTNLETLYLGGNLLTGDIPPALTRLSNLKQMSLEGNSFSGCRPEGLEVRERAHMRLPYCVKKT